MSGSRKGERMKEVLEERNGKRDGMLADHLCTFDIGSCFNLICLLLTVYCLLFLP